MDETKYEKELRTNKYLNEFNKINNELLLQIYKLERYEKLKVYYEILINCLGNQYKTSEVIQSITSGIADNIITFVEYLIQDIFKLYDNLSTLNEKYEKVWIFKEDKWGYREEFKLENEKEILIYCKRILDMLLGGKIYFKRTDENKTTKKRLQICRRLINDITGDLSKFLTYYDNESNMEIWELLYPDEKCEDIIKSVRDNLEEFLTEYKKNDIKV